MPDAVDREQHEREGEPRAQLGDPEDVGDGVHVAGTLTDGRRGPTQRTAWARQPPAATPRALTPWRRPCRRAPCWRLRACASSAEPVHLAARLLDRLLGRRRDACALDRQLGLQLAVAQDLDAVQRPSPARPHERASSTVAPAPKAPEVAEVDDRVLLAVGVVKPNFGRRRWSGLCPPSKPSKCMLPERAFWPLPPRPAVLPRPEPWPRPTRFLRARAVAGLRSLFSVDHGALLPRPVR